MSIRGVRLNIQDLSYRYSTRGQPTFTELNLQARPGEALAIIRRPGCGKSRQLGVGLHEPAESLGSGRNEGQSVPDVVLPVGGPGFTAAEAFEAGGDGFDRGEGVVEFVAQNADQALPGLAFLVAQGAAEVGNDDELMRAPALAETGTTETEAADAAGEGRRGEAGGFPVEC